MPNDVEIIDNKILWKGNHVGNFLDKKHNVWIEQFREAIQEKFYNDERPYEEE